MSEPGDTTNVGQARTGVAHGPEQRRRVPPLTKAQRLTLQDQALELNLAGNSYGKIAALLSNEAMQRALGIVPHRPIPKVMAFRLVDKALAKTKEEVGEKADRKRERELRRLDAMFVALWPQRKVPRAADSLLRISERRAKLEGLDAAIKVKHEGELATSPGLPLKDMTDEELAKLEEITAAVAVRAAAKMGAAAAGAVPGATSEEGSDEP